MPLVVEDPFAHLQIVVEVVVGGVDWRVEGASSVDHFVRTLSPSMRQVLLISHLLLLRMHLERITPVQILPPLVDQWWQLLLRGKPGLRHGETTINTVDLKFIRGHISFAFPVFAVVLLPLLSKRRTVKKLRQVEAVLANL